MSNQQRWYAGVDWASTNHHVRITNSEGRTIGEKIFNHSGEGLSQMADWLMATSGAASPSQIYVAIEVPHGPVVETLIERGFNVHVSSIRHKLGLTAAGRSHIQTIRGQGYQLIKD